MNYEFIERAIFQVNFLQILGNFWSIIWSFFDDILANFREFLIDYLVILKLNSVEIELIYCISGVIPNEIESNSPVSRFTSTPNEDELHFESHLC